MTRLGKELGLAQYFTIGFGAIIGTGWVTVLGSWLQQAGPLGAMLAFATGGVIILLVGLCYAEMATMIPVSGAEVAYAYEVFGVEACFATGWLLALVYMATTAFEAISAAWLLAALVPGTEGPVLYQSLGSPVRLSTVVIGVGGTIYLAYLNYRGVRAAARFQDFFTWGLVILSALFMSVGVFFGHTSNLVPLFREGGFGSAVAGFTAVFVTSPFWLAGFNLVPQAMEEAAPGTSVRKVGQVMLLSIAAAVAFYCLVILASAMTQPWKDLLTLELTEGVMISDTGVVVDRLHALKDLGVQLAIDDFGTGYSSLGHLRQLPFDVLKIDKTFVDHVAHGAEESAFARAIIKLGQTLGLTMVAEGVEHADQAARLGELGCDFAQGYWFAKPLNVDGVEAVLGIAAGPNHWVGLDHLDRASWSS